MLKPAAELERHRAAVTCVGFSPNGALLATADSNRELLLWDTQTMQVIIIITIIVIIISTAATTIILILILIIYDINRRHQCHFHSNTVVINATSTPTPPSSPTSLYSHYSHYSHAGQPERLAVSLRKDHLRVLGARQQSLGHRQH